MIKPRVIIESPLNGDIERNLKYARRCMKDSLSRGEAPFASHVLYCHEELLDDHDPAQRVDGMEAGFAWGEAADFVAVYTDLGLSPGMKTGIKRAEGRGKKIVYRSLTVRMDRPYCPRCGGDSHRHGKADGDRARYICKDCSRTFIDVAVIAKCECGRANNHRGVCTERATARQRQIARNRAYLARKPRSVDRAQALPPSLPFRTGCIHGLGSGTCAVCRRKNDPGFEGRERI